MHACDRLIGWYFVHGIHHDVLQDRTQSSRTCLTLDGLSGNLNQGIYRFEAGYTYVFEPQNVTDFCPTDVTVGDDGFGTAVFSMPENAVDPQAWKRAANALVANFLCYYQYNGNNVEFCVEIVKQEAADGQGEAADYMVIFAKKHDGEEGGEIWTPPAL